jgi:hypothetical protein
VGDRRDAGRRLVGVGSEKKAPPLASEEAAPRGSMATPVKSSQRRGHLRRTFTTETHEVLLKLSHRESIPYLRKASFFVSLNVSET